jgi:hypothetical protein
MYHPPANIVSLQAEPNFLTTSMFIYLTLKNARLMPTKKQPNYKSTCSKNSYLMPI